MEYAVLSCEFLVSPATCDAAVISEQVESLLDLKNMVPACAVVPLLEDDALAKLIAASLYPAEGIFKRNLTECGVIAFSAKDLSRIVNSILTESIAYGHHFSEKLAEWQSKEFIPSFDLLPDRKEQLEEVIEQVSLSVRLGEGAVALVFYCNGNVSQVCVKGNLTEMIPRGGIDLPEDFEQSIKVFRSYKSYLASLSRHEVFSRVTDAQSLKFAMYVGALSKLREAGRDYSFISWHDINIGNKFYDSLKMNQCLPGQGFGSVMFERVTDVLTSNPRDASSEFKVDAGGEKARAVGKCTAYRAHITKSGVGLRLMYWVDQHGSIEFANVGPKQELLIADPSILSCKS